MGPYIRLSVKTCTRKVSDRRTQEIMGHLREHCALLQKQWILGLLDSPISTLINSGKNKLQKLTKVSRWKGFRGCQRWWEWWSRQCQSASSLYKVGFHLCIFRPLRLACNFLQKAINSQNLYLLRASRTLDRKLYAHLYKLSSSELDLLSGNLSDVHFALI